LENEQTVKKLHDPRVDIVSNRFITADLAFDLEFLVARAHAVGSKIANLYLQPLGLKVRSYAVLSLACSGMKPSQKELAEFLSLDASQVVALVDELEHKGLIIRRTDEKDRRSNVLEPTELGIKKLGEAQKAIENAQKQSLVNLNHKEREDLRRLLGLIAFD
jgi:DNA-binding MarR family transcriptional regulator